MHIRVEHHEFIRTKLSWKRTHVHRVILQHIFALLVPSSLSSIEKEAALASSEGMLGQKRLLIHTTTLKSDDSLLWDFSL